MIKIEGRYLEAQDVVLVAPAESPFKTRICLRNGSEFEVDLTVDEVHAIVEDREPQSIDDALTAHR
jgi:hypothetical protein